jgi:hypothetical protein
MSQFSGWCRRVLVQRWKLWLLVLTFLSTVLGLLWAYPPVKVGDGVDSAGVAAWIQGVGTVAAVLASAWIARDQHDWQRAAEDQRRKEDLRLELLVLHQTLSRLHEIVCHCLEALHHHDAARTDFYRNLDLDEIAGLIGVLQMAPLSTAHGPSLHVLNHKARGAAQTARGKIELIATAVRKGAGIDFLEDRAASLRYGEYVLHTARDELLSRLAP